MEDKVTVSFRMSGKTKAALDQIATSMERDRSFVLNEAIAEFIERQKAYAASIRRGLQEAKAENFATDEEVEAALAAWER
jgi:predicted transcriptional regulator